MKRAKSDCVTLWGFSCDSKMIVWSQSKDCEPVECEDHLDSLSAVICLSECFPSLLGFNLLTFIFNCISRTLHLSLISRAAVFSFCFPNYLPTLCLKNFNSSTVAEALMSEFDAENKGDNGDLHTAYTGKGKGDDSESLMCYQ
ncbi:hypothetical protein ACFX2B_024170 [Malus domestica]